MHPKGNTSMRSTAICLLVAAPCILLGIAQSRGENLIINPSAEEGTPNQSPPGWGLYIGAGTATVTVAPNEKRSGQAAACLELTGWYTPKDAPDKPENHSVSAAIVLAPNDGYSAKGSIQGKPGTTYAFSFWYKGDLATATAVVIGWPSTDADYTKRTGVPVTTNTLHPGNTWQQCTGTFQLTEPLRAFALMIQTGGQEKDGFRMGRLYIDDAEVGSKAFPDGQMRAIWCALPKATNREQGSREVAGTLDKLKACGLNTLFVWTESLYIATLNRPGLPQGDTRAAWDGMGEMIKAAQDRRMQVHVWYSPWIYKDKGRAVELREHPDWMAVNAKGAADPDGVCLARPEVRRYELDLLRSLVDRYPDLAGIHIEEPGYNWGEYCYCDHCRKLCRDWYGMDTAADTDTARPLLRHLAASSCTDFIIRLRQMLLSKRPGAWLSANGCGGTGAEIDWQIGRDWVAWARHGYIDFYVPQLYTRSVEDFIQGGLKTKELLGGCDLVTGMAVSWSGIYPERQAPAVIQGQIRAAEQLGAKGFAVYHLDHFQEPHFQAIREAVQGQTTGPGR
jgi:hypothetical protein